MKSSQAHATKPLGPDGPSNRGPDAPPYRFGALSFVPPRGWDDQTNFCFTHPSVLGGATIFVTRDALNQFEPIRQFMPRKFALLRAQIDGIELVALDTTTSVAGRNAYKMHVRFPSPAAGPAEQIMVAIEGASSNESTVTLLSAASLAPSFDDVRGAFSMFLRNVRFHHDSGSNGDLPASRLRLANVSFERLPGWNAAAHFVFNHPAPGAAIVVVPERLAPGETFEGFVSRRISRLGAESRDFEILERGPVRPIGGRSAQILRFRVTPPNESEPFHETMVLVDPGTADREVILFSAAAPARSEGQGLAASTLAEIFASVRFTSAAPMDEIPMSFWTPLPGGRR